MTRRVAAAAAAVLWTVAAADPVLAHGIGGRIDLPVPRWLFVFGAATALVISFVLLGALWREPRFPLPRRRGGDGPLQAELRNPAVEWTLRLLALAWFLVVAGSALTGASTGATIAPVAVFIWFWVGGAFVQAFLGDWWATLSPFDTLGRLFGLDYAGEEPPHRYPARLGTWPAAIGLFAFVWLELVDPFGGRPGSLGLCLVVYTAAQIAGMARYGRAAWVRDGETFSVYLGLLARISPLRRDDEGRVVVVAPVASLAEVATRPGLLALVLVALGSTTFDGASRTALWRETVAPFHGLPLVAASTAGLLLAIGVVAALYALAMRAAAASGGRSWRELAADFAHTLVPIAFAYVVAHYFSYLLIEGQIGIARVSDPFGLGWDLLGTADRPVELAIVGPATVWYVQVAAIVLGHVAGVVLAHDLALRRFPGPGALRTQFALLAVMVLFTAGGLLILSG
ncbi:MAG: hypothetical protein ACKO8G_03755 [Actinomycetota bacterium]